MQIANIVGRVSALGGGLGLPKSIEKRVPLLICELDGAIRVSETELGRPIRDPAKDVVIHDGAVQQLKAWKLNGGRIIAILNAGDLSIGRIDIETLVLCLKHTVDLTGALIDKIPFCMHHPDAADPEYSRCWCRIPSPGLIIESAIPLAHRNREMYPPCIGMFVGATVEGEQCAKLAGFPFMPASKWHREGKLLV